MNGILLNSNSSPLEVCPILEILLKRNLKTKLEENMNKFPRKPILQRSFDPPTQFKQIYLFDSFLQ
jgi:hypothetical protein